MDNYLMARLAKRDKAINDREKILKSHKKGFVSSEHIEKMNTEIEARRKEFIGKSFGMFVQFEKKDNGEKRLVGGIATSESIDCQGDIITYEAVKGAMAEYMKFGNIREMHAPSAVGVVKDYELNDKDRNLYITAKIVDDMARTKVVEGVYKGFSIGGRVLECEPLMITTEDENGNIYEVYNGGMRVTKLEMVEISLVDRGANPDAMIDTYKMNKSDFLPEYSFVKKDETQNMKKTFLTDNNTDMFQKLRDAVVSNFAKGGVDLEKMQGDETVVSMTKGEIADLIKSSIEEASNDVEGEKEDNKEDEKEGEKEGEGEDDKGTEDKEEEKESEGEEENKEDNKEDEKKDEDKNTEETIEKSFKSFEKTVGGQITDLVNTVSKLSETVVQLQKNATEHTQFVQDIAKNAGISTQKDGEPKKKEASVFKGML